MGGRSGQGVRSASVGLRSFPDATVYADAGLSAEEQRRYLNLTGIPSDFDGSIGFSKAANGKVTVRLSRIDFSMRREIDDSTGEIYNAFFKVETGGKYDGRGFEIFNNQITSARKAGFKKISVTAAGEKGSDFNGYYTWLRFGYVPNNNKGHFKLAEINNRLAARGQQRFDSLTEMMKTPNGRLLWKEYGAGWSGEFDLKSNSYSSRTLSAYVRARKAKKN
jgi:hypothetical protein